MIQYFTPRVDNLVIESWHELLKSSTFHLLRLADSLMAVDWLVPWP
jgi:hypothetical protein